MHFVDHCCEYDKNKPLELMKAHAIHLHVSCRHPYFICCLVISASFSVVLVVYLSILLKCGYVPFCCLLLFSAFCAQKHSNQTLKLSTGTLLSGCDVFAFCFVLSFQVQQYTVCTIITTCTT